MQKVTSSLDMTRLKQYRLWGVIAVVLIWVVVMVVLLRPKPPVMHKPVDHQLIEVKVPKDDLKQWTMASAAQMHALATSNQQLKRQLNQYHDALTHMTTVVQRHEALMAKIKQQHAAGSCQVKGAGTARGKARAVSHRIKSSGLPDLPDLLKSPRQHQAKQPSKHVAVFASDVPTVRHRINTLMPPKSMVKLSKKLPKHALGQWLPMGSFFKADLLNGVEAGTGSHAQANPQPVLMRVVSDAFLPNAGHFPVKSCFILGSAYASLSSERVYIRLARMACVGAEHRRILSAKIKGYIVDSDGKIGLRGHLVNRQGAKLGKAMLAGFFAGLSGLGAHAQGHSVLGALGVTHTSDASETVRSAGFAGLGNATKELSSFYIGEAKRLFPVIEVGAGRQVMVTVSQGVRLIWGQH